MKVKVSLPIIIVILAVVGIGGILVFKGKSVNKKGEIQTSQENVQVQGEVREIEVTAKQWEFTPNPIKVKFGERVRLKIKSIDVTHGFALPDFGINEVLNPEQEVVVEFVANKRGTFDFFCSVQCGQGHAGMRGQLVVE